MNRSARSLAAILIPLLAGCTAALRTVEVQQPLTARPEPVAAAVPTAGAIYAASTHRPLFEDRRARRVGDTLTISINEKLNASKKAATTASRTGATSFGVPTATHLGRLSKIAGAELAASSANEFEGKGDSGANNLFTGTFAVTVIEVLPNGNLAVSGEKQLGINQGSEFVRVSGIVDPATILPGNVVSSTQVADARLEYRGTGYIDEAQTMGWLARTFQSILPF